jgi:hypothetical protein
MLSLILAASANAGDIHTTITTTPNVPAVTTEGDIHTMRAGDITTMNADAQVTGVSATDAAMAFIQSVLSLL